MVVRTSAGTTLAVSATLPATEDQAGYEALTPTVVGEITNIGAFGKTYNLVTHSPVGDRRVRKIKGSYNTGAFPLEIGRDTADAGQDLLEAAVDIDTDQAFEITLQDGTKIYCSGIVMSFTTNINGVDDITGHTCQVEINTDLIVVDPT